MTTFAGGWNHRVLRQIHNVEPFPPEVMFSIHEVYYDSDGNPSSWTTEPIAVVGDTWKDAIEMWMQMKRAFDLPVLQVQDGKLVETEERV